MTSSGNFIVFRISRQGHNAPQYNSSILHIRISAACSGFLSSSPPPVSSAIELVAATRRVLGIGGEPVSVTNETVIVQAVPNPWNVILGTYAVAPHVIHALTDPATVASTVPAEDVRALARKVANGVSRISATSLH